MYLPTHGTPYMLTIQLKNMCFSSEMTALALLLLTKRDACKHLVTALTRVAVSLARISDEFTRGLPGVVSCQCDTTSTLSYEVAQGPLQENTCTSLRESWQRGHFDMAA